MEQTKEQRKSRRTCECGLCTTCKGRERQRRFRLRKKAIKFQLSIMRSKNLIR